jgi:hypothetical protein
VSVSGPRYLNTRGGLPTWTPPTFAQVITLAEVARAAGFEATVTTDCKAVVHNVCRSIWNRHTRTSTCQRGDVQLLDVATIERLAAVRDACTEHNTVAA